MPSQAVLELMVQLKDNASSGLASLGSAIGSLGAVAGGVALAGVAGLGAAIAAGVGDARAAALVMAQTEAVIKSTGGAAGMSATQVSDFAASLSAASGKSLFGDDDIQASTNLLLTFTNLKGAVLESATAISVDMAQAMGGAPKDAAIQLGKALNDPIAGISALSKVGVSFTEQQKEQIATMVKAGDVAGAQGVIIGELNKEFGGSAAAAAAADGGVSQFTDRMGEAAEVAGNALLPIMSDIFSFLNGSVAPIVERAAQTFSNLVAAFRTGASEGGGFIGGLTNALYSLDSISPIFDRLGDGVLVVAQIFTSLASQAQGWGAGIVEQLAGGMAQAAASVVRVLMQLGAIITGWLRPNSPPKILPEIDQWGQETAQLWVDGFGAADTGAITQLGSAVQSVLKNLSAQGKGDQAGIIPTVLGSERAIADAIRSADEFGNVSEDAIQKVIAASGAAGPEVEGMVRNFFELRQATADVARAQDDLNRVTDDYAQKLSPLNARLKQIQDQKRAIDDQIRIKKLQEEIASGKTDDLTRQKDLLEIQEIQTRQQIDGVEKERDTAVDAEKQKLDGAKANQAAIQAQAKDQQATLQLYNQQNQMIGEQAALMERLAKAAESAAKGGGGGGGAGIGAGISMPEIAAPVMPDLNASIQPLKDITTAVDDTSARVMVMRDNVVGAFETVGAAVLQYSPAFQILRAIVEAAIPPVRDIVLSVFGIITGFLQQNGAQMLADVQMTWGALQATIAGLIGPIQTTVVAGFGIITDFLHAHGDDIQAFLAQTWGAIVGIVNTALPLIQGIITGVLAVIVGFIQEHGAQIQQVLGAAWEIIKNVITGALALIQGVLSAALAIFQGNWAGAWQAIQQMSVTVTQALGEIIKNALDIIAAFFGTSLDGIVKTWTNNFNMLTQVAGAVVDDMVDIGQNIVAGIKQGVLDGWGAFMNWLEDQMAQIPEPIRAALGINSPSEVMANSIGAPLIQGIIMGMEDELPALFNSLNQIALNTMLATEDITDEQRTALGKQIDELTAQAAQVGKLFNSALASGFSAESSIDRQMAKNIDSLSKVSEQARNFADAQLQTATATAAQFADPATGAKYLKMRSDQIFELAKLQDQIGSETDAKAKARLQQQMSLIVAAQAVEQKAFRADAANDSNPMQKVIDQLNTVLASAAELNLPNNPITAQLMAYRDELQNSTGGFNAPTYTPLTTAPTSAPVGRDPNKGIPQRPIYNTFNLPPGTPAQMATETIRLMNKSVNGRRG